MTAQTSDFSGLLYYNPAGPGFNPVASATVTGPASINEGSTATFNVVTWGIPNGTTLYWQARNRFNINIGRFSAVGGTFTIIKNRGSFTITVDANHTTQNGQQTYAACISKVSTTSDDILAVFSGVVVNDTSLTPAKPTGLIRKTYNGYYYTGTEASQWFKDKTPIDTLIGAPLGDGDPAPVYIQYQSYEWVGYFSPPATDDYTFYVNSDDYTLVWIGSNAVSAYTNSNADIACATSNSVQSSAISLTGGDFVPIRIQFGNNTGGGELHVSWSSTQHPTPSRNFNWLIYHDPETATAGTNIDKYSI